MRPERLRLKGFGAFRQQTEIDFSGVELFALTGPTGSGKTTVLDGICFALYGSVPRYGKGAVAPVVSQGLIEATVALTFSVGDKAYQVARRVKRDAKGKGAGIIEASLEHVQKDLAIEVLATGGQVTDRVTDLLGLDFEQFTTCVLLPQGEFARFLHDKPADRQDLLTALLDLGIYDRVGQLALTRQRTAEGLLGLIDKRLSDLAGITDEDLVVARHREATLDELLRWVEETLPELTALEHEARDLRSEADHQEAMLIALRSFEMPKGLAATGMEVTTLRLQEQEARAALEDARSRVTSLVENGADLPARSQIESWVKARSALASAEGDLHPAARAAAKSAAALQAAVAAVVSARDAVAKAADGDRAAHLRRGLKPGDPCPVCGQRITDLPKVQRTGTDKAEAALAKSENDEQKMRKSNVEAENLVRRLENRLADLALQLDGVADLDELGALAARVEDHEKAVSATQAEVAVSKRRLDQLEERRKETAEREAAIRSGLQKAWAIVAQAGLEPPTFDMQDPFRSWQELAGWRTVTEPRFVESVGKARALVEEAGQRRIILARAIVERLEAVEVTPGPASPRDAVVDALGVARTRSERIESALEELEAKSAERDLAARHQAVARQLNLELRADRFKKWLFDEVFTALVAGANLRLGDLTGGQYELALDGPNFEVIDNLSAGNRRSIRSLSGGETFLVSLALALALAEQVAETSVGEERLDSFFLDEGFGTLDAESLEVVAGVITDLGASGKTVGIVTHVAELAEQMPVRYEIRKTAYGAAVTEVRQ